MSGKLVTIADCCDILDALRRPVSAAQRLARSGDVPYFGANGRQGWIDDWLFDEELVLVAEDGGHFDDYATRPIAYMIRGKAWVNNHAHVLRARPGVATTAWIYYCLVHRDIRRYIGGAAPRTKLTQAALRRIEITLPPPAEQERICRGLAGADASIAASEAVLAQLKVTRAGLADDLLGGERGWPEVRLADICTDIADCSHTTPATLVPDGVLIARTEQIRDGRFDEASAPRVTEDEYRRRTARAQPGAGDVILTREAPVGEAFVVPEGMPVCLGQRTVLLRPGDDLHPGYLLAQLYSGALRVHIGRVAAGTASPHLNLADVRALPVPVPALAEQERVVRVLAACDARLQAEEAYLAKLRLMKRGLMADLLGGT